MVSKRIIFFVYVLFTFIWTSAQKPKWVNNTPLELNKTYKFVEIISTGNDLNSARIDALRLLAQDRQLTNAINVNVESGKLTHVDQTTVNGNFNETIKEQIDINVKISGENYQVQGQKIDEFAEKSSNGQIKLHTLFMVAICNNPVFDNVYLTDKYGFTPAIFSLIPGAGQMYKGSYLKGGCILGSEILCAAGIILCESQRADYKNKVKEQPRFAKTYNTKANNWAIGRNLCIGMAGAIYIYNLIDAAISSGARIVKIKQSGKATFSYKPFFILDNMNKSSAGINLTYNF